MRRMKQCPRCLTMFFLTPTDCNGRESRIQDILLAIMRIDRVCSYQGERNKQVSAYVRALIIDFIDVLTAGLVHWSKKIGQKLQNA